MAIFKVNESFLHALFAGEDLTGDLNKFVMVNESGQAVLATNGAVVFGTVYEEAALGYPATVQFAGLAKVKTGAIVRAGQRVMSNASGLAIEATAGLYCAGIALVGGASGDVITVALLSSRV